jgi:hypothetical protein
MDISWTFTGDGLLAFAGGALALIGVWWSNHQSVRNLQKQLDAERVGRAEEGQRHKRALATALVFEIDHCCRSYLPRTLTLARGLRGKTLDPKAGVVVRFEAAAFDVYSGNVQSLGTLGPEASGPVIRFYKIAWDLQDLMRHYRECLAQGDPFKISDNTLAAIEHVSSGLKIGALEACSWLCLAAGLPIDSTDVGVLKDKAEIMELAKSMNVSLSLPGRGGQ